MSRAGGRLFGAAPNNQVPNHIPPSGGFGAFNARNNNNVMLA